MWHSMQTKIRVNIQIHTIIENQAQMMSLYHKYMTFIRLKMYLAYDHSVHR